MTLSTKEREVLDQVVAVLRKHYGERLSRVVLFGSRARRDHKEYSDYDILVVLNEDFDAYLERKTLMQLMIPLDLENDTVVFCHAVSNNRYSTEQSNFLMNVRADGVELFVNNEGTQTAWTRPDCLEIPTS